MNLRRKTYCSKNREEHITYSQTIGYYTTGMPTNLSEDLMMKNYMFGMVPTVHQFALLCRTIFHRHSRSLEMAYKRCSRITTEIFPLSLSTLLIRNVSAGNKSITFIQLGNTKIQITFFWKWKY